MSRNGFQSIARVLAGVGVLSALPSLAFAITISPTNNKMDLANTLFLNVPGLTISSADLQGYYDDFGKSQSGIYENTVGTYGLPVSGIVLSSGNVADFGTGYDTDDQSTQFDTAATEAQNALLEPITGQSVHFDVVQLDIEFVPLNVSSVTFFATFGSEEYPDFLGSPFVDGFGLFVNGVNVAGVLQTGGVAGDPLLAVNINHPDMVYEEGTELNGILAPNGNPVLRFDVPVISGQANLFQIILGDATDDQLDTTVYLSSFIPTPGGGGGGDDEAVGETEFNPLLPSNPPDPETGSFVIDFADVWQNFDEDDVIWIDPPVTVGYFYEITGGAVFTGLLAPSLAAVADVDGYTIQVGNMSIQIGAGEALDFSDWLGFDVTEFSVLGINPALGLDPLDSMAFPIGVNVSGLSATTTVIITPETVEVAAVPLPAGFGLYLLGLAGVGGLAVARRSRRR